MDVMVTAPSGPGENGDIDVEGAQNAHEGEVHAREHLRSPGAGDVAQVDDPVLQPAELAENTADDALGALVVPGHEDVVVAGHPRRVDHHLGVGGVERLDHSGARELALELLGEGVGVDHGESGRQPPGQVQRLGHIENDLAVERLGANAPESLQRDAACRGVDDELGACGGVGHGGQADIGVLAPPLGEGRGAHLVGLGAGERGLDVTGADGDLVTGFGELGGEDAPHHSGADDCDSH